MKKSEKIKKLYRFFFPKTFTHSELFEQKMKRNSKVVFFERKGELYEVALINGIKLNVRNENYSDYYVLEQIFNYKEYEIVLGLIELNGFSDKPKIIIDAGANVGYTTVFFAHHLKFSKIYAIEPSAVNAEMIKKNITFLNGNTEIELYQKALSHKEGMFYTINRDFRDGLDWAISTVPNLEGDIEGITISEISKKHKLEYISLLKIDIEGAERFIFNVENDLSFLKITEIIAVEIHDEFNIRTSIYTILRENNFFLMESGELTIAINRNLF
jgi:FkbM family methyltransferase